MTRQETVRCNRRRLEHIVRGRDMNILVPCAHCGSMIGEQRYMNDGVYVFHEGCLPSVRYPRFLHGLEENPSGSSLRPVAMNLTMCTGMEIVMKSLTEPSHCSGLNFMSMKLPF